MNTGLVVVSRVGELARLFMPFQSGSLFLTITTKTRVNCFVSARHWFSISSLIRVSLWQTQWSIPRTLNLHSPSRLAPLDNAEDSIHIRLNAIVLIGVSKAT